MDRSKKKSIMVKRSRDWSENTLPTMIDLFDFTFDIGKNFDHYFPENNLKSVVEKIKSVQGKKLKRRYSPKKMKIPNLSRLKGKSNSKGLINLNQIQNEENDI